MTSSILAGCGGGGPNNDAPPPPAATVQADKAPAVATPAAVRTWHVAEQLDQAYPGALLSVESGAVVNATGDAIVVWGQAPGIFSSELSATTGWHATTVTEQTASSYQPQIAMDANGHATAIWGQLDGIWSSSYTSGTGWAPAARVSDIDAAGALYPRMAFDQSGGATAVWQQGGESGTNVWANRYQAGSGWGTPQLIETNDLGSAQNPELAVDANGDSMAVWRHAEPFGFYSVWVNRFKPGTGWGTPEQIVASGAVVDNIQISYLSPGRAMVVWSQNGGIWARQFSAAQEWSAAIRVNDADAGFSYSAAIASDNNGLALITWLQRGTVTRTGVCLQAASVGGSSGCSPRISVIAKVWSRSYNQDTGLSAPVPVQSDEGGSAADQRISFDAAGNAVAIWAQSNGVHTSIWANRFTSATGWGTTATQIQSSSTEDASSPSLAVSPNGSAIAVWSQYNGKQPATVWANRLF
jgi:hypothetical protein